MKWLMATIGAWLMMAPGATLAVDTVDVVPHVEFQSREATDGWVAVLSNGTVLIECADGENFILQSPEASEHGLYWDRRNGWYIGEAHRSPRSKLGWAFTGEDVYDTEPLLELAGLVTVDVQMADAATILVQVQGDDGIFAHEFWLADAVPQGSVASSSSTCAVTCSNGSASVTCNGGRGCYAVCKTDGTPTVGCGKQKWVVY